MPENDATIRWRLQAAERALEQKADAKDLNGLAVVVREGFEKVNKRFDDQDRRNEQDQKDIRARQRQTFWLIAGFAVTILATLLGSGQFS